MDKPAFVALFASFLMLFGCISSPQQQNSGSWQIASRQMNGTECGLLGGRIVNTLGDSCLENETDAGEVEGMLCPCICCVPRLASKGTLNSSECIGLGGRIEGETVETPLGGFKNKGCLPNETDMGSLDDLLCPCVCCVPAK